MRLRHAVLLTPSKSSGLNELLSCKQIAPVSLRIPFFVFKRLRTLSFSVSCKSCVCHSYENSRVCTNNSHSGTHSLDRNYHRSSFFSCACELPILQPLCFDGLEFNGGTPLPSTFDIRTFRLADVSIYFPYLLTSLRPYFVASSPHLTDRELAAIMDSQFKRSSISCNTAALAAPDGMSAKLVTVCGDSPAGPAPTTPNRSTPCNAPSISPAIFSTRLGPSAKPAPNRSSHKT